MNRRIKGAIIDVDGTLIDSNDAHARAWVQALATADVQVSFPDVRRLIGMGGDNLLPAIANIDADSELGRRLSERRGELFREHYLPRLRPFARARALLVRMRDAGLSLAIASSAAEEELGALLRVADVVDVAGPTTSSGDVERSKPEPDVVRAALARLELDPERVLMLGDTPFDVESATRAGVRTVALRSGGRSDADLRGALAIYDDCADLLQNFATSPFAE